jgi:hypothetical protein
MDTKVSSACNLLSWSMVRQAVRWRVSHFPGFGILFIDIWFQDGGSAFSRSPPTWDNTKHWKTHKYTHSPNGIRTADLSIRAAENSTRLRLHGRSNQLYQRSKKKVTLSLCLTNLALRHQGVWGVDVYIHAFLISATTPQGRASGTHWIGGWVGSKTGLDDVEKREISLVPGLELPHLGRPARSQLLYRLSYPGFCIKTPQFNTGLKGSLAEH